MLNGRTKTHEVILKIDKDSAPYDITTVDVAINFSTPDSAVENIRLALENRVPVISGTTGWLSEMEDRIDLESLPSSRHLQSLGQTAPRHHRRHRTQLLHAALS